MKNRDPYWTTARFPGKCAKTGAPFLRGASIFYFPATREAYFGEAAEQAARDFAAACADESFDNAGGGY
jgi:hypothetical protein